MSWGLVAVAGATLVGGTIAGQGAKDAARAQARGADAATAETARQYDQTRRDFAPYRTAGAGALNQLTRLFGIDTSVGGGNAEVNTDYGIGAGAVPTVNSQLYQSDPAYRAAWDQVLAEQKQLDPRGFYHKAQEHDAALINEKLAKYSAQFRDANKPAEGAPGTAGTPDMSGFFTSPGYQFRRDEGMRGIERTAAARGGAFSGNALRALTDFNSNIASGEFGQYVNQLAGIAGTGQTATSQTAAFGADAANSASRNALFSADARASGIIGQSNAIGQGVSDLAGLYGYYKNNRVPAGYGGTGYGGNSLASSGVRYG